MTPSTNMPLNKVTFGTLAGLALTIVFMALRRYTAVEIDPELQTAITALVGGIVAYMTPIAPGEVKPADAAAVERERLVQ